MQTRKSKQRNQNLFKSYVLSVVVPCLNEEEVIDTTHTRLTSVLESMDCNYELVYIDDGSTDDTLDKLNRLGESAVNVVVVSLTRNYGQQPATSAGLDYSNGDAVVIIDADLQDPPELIPNMFHEWLAGADVVYGVRTPHKNETWFKRWSSIGYYKILNLLSETDIPRNTGDFQLLDRRVIDVLLSMPERDRFLRGMIAWTGFNRVPLHYSRDIRRAGTTKYPVRKMLNFALDGVFSFSSRPLRVATYVGIFVSCLALLGILYAVGMRLLSDNWVSGWTFLAVTILLLGGIQLIFLGVIGEYIARIYNQAKDRPLYIVDLAHRNGVAHEKKGGTDTGQIKGPLKDNRKEDSVVDEY